MNLVSFFHRFLGPRPPEAPVPVSAMSLPIEERYWSPAIHDWLMLHRFISDFDPPIQLATEELIVKMVAGGAHAAAALDERSWVWTAWVTLSLSDPNDSGTSILLDAQRFLARYHYWAGPHPGQSLPSLLRTAAGDTNLSQLLERALPSEVTHLAASFRSALMDQRLAVWAALDTGGLELQGERLRSLLDVDPPAGTEAPQEWTSEWLSRRTYQRWRLHGLVYGFTHHSGFILHRNQPWLERLCRPRRASEASGAAGAYFDLALMVLAEAAMQLAQPSRAGFRNGVGDDLTSCGGRLRQLQTFPTPIDQGRDLLRIWRAVYKRDLQLSAGDRADAEKSIKGDRA